MSVDSAPSLIVASVLVHEILEKLYYIEPEGRIDRHSLLHCSTVCRLWAGPAQRLLFRSLVLTTAGHAEAFCLAISRNHLKTAGLFSNVRILTLMVDVRWRKAGVSPNLFAQLVTKCVCLYELSISAPSVHALDQETLDTLSDIPPIKSLNILKAGVQSILLYQLLLLAPSVRHLHLTPELHATPPDEPARFRLFELSTFRAPHPDVLTWLLGASHDSLRILEMWDMCNNDTMRALMQRHGHHLLSLRIKRANYLAAEMIQNCPNLKELMTWYFHVVTGHWDIPSTVEHLLFLNPPHPNTYTLGPILYAVRQLPNLRLVTCDENTTEHADFQNLRSLCEEFGVELRSIALRFTIVSAISLLIYTMNSILLHYS